MFGGGQACGSLRGIDQARDVQQYRSSGFLGAKPSNLPNSGLAEPRGQPEDSCQRAQIGLLVLMQFREGSARGGGFCAAIVTHRGSKQFPLLAGPRWRHRLLLEKSVRRFLPRFAGSLQAQSAKPRGGAENATHIRVVKGGGEACVGKGIE